MASANSTLIYKGLIESYVALVLCNAECKWSVVNATQNRIGLYLIYF